ncbi:MAG: hypothetical protein EPO12_00580 [Aquabacterium sp.]|nr:MAG: hypothetical protein EPO12_00580 [Aquabacterium sp.]
MKLQADNAEGVNLISSYTPQMVTINGQPWTTSVLLPASGEVQAWHAAAFEDLTAAHFEALAVLQPELVIFGSGGRLRFPRPAFLRPLIERRIGIETMDTGAACRTYNILVSEGRKVAAALLFEQPTHERERIAPAA